MKKLFLMVVAMLAMLTTVSAQDQSKYDETYLPAKYAVEKEKPTLVMITATWCGPCKMMKNNIMKDVEVEKILKKMNVVYFDVDQKDLKDIISKFKPAGFKGSIPFFAILDNNGKIITTQLGSSDKSKFIVFLNNAFKADKK